MVESIQKKLLRVRPPRVKITYDVHTGGAIEKRELPFIVGIFADLSGDADKNAKGDFKQRKMVDIDRDNFNDVLKQSQPCAALKTVSDVINGGNKTIKTPLTFASLDDFEPLNVIKNVDIMNKVFEQRKLLRELQARTEVNDTLADNLEVAIQTLDTTSPPPKAINTELNNVLSSTDPRLADFKQAFTDRVLPLYDVTQNAPARGLNAAAVIDLAVSSIDTLLSQQLSLVMHDDGFKALEATWRSLFYLVSRSETGTMLKLRVFNATLDELRSDMEKAVEFDQSHLFKMIYEAEYGTLGGTPYSLLVGGYEITPVGNDIQFLSKIAEVAASAHAPFITAAGPEMFGLANGFSNLAKPRDLAKIFESPTMQAWQEFRGSEDSRYVTLVMPRVLLRLPYGEKSNPVEGIGFEESVSPDQITQAAVDAATQSIATLETDPLIAAIKTARAAEQQAMEKVAEAQLAFRAALKDLENASAADKAAKQAAFDQAGTDMESAAGDAAKASTQVQAARAKAELDDVVAPKLRSWESQLALLAKAAQPNSGLPDNAKFLWGNAAYFLAERITNAFSLYSWTAAIRGVEGGGLIEGLPLYTYSTSDDSEGIVELFCPTEVAITDRREKELSDLGFIALCHSKGSGQAAFFGGQTSNKPKKYINDDANANAALSARLPYILAASRFAHYIKVIVRDKVGGFLTRGNVEQYLNTWIGQYILLDDNASQDVKAGFPLRAAQIVVIDVPGSPGAYKATIFLKPHFQLEELTASIRLVANLPA